eukprot:69208_1
MTDPFHHRSNFGSKRKSHKLKGKSKPSSDNKSFGRTCNDPNPNDRKFRHCNQFRDIGKAQRKATAKERRKTHREQAIKTKLKYYAKIQGGTPKIIAVVALSPHSDTNKVTQHLLRHCGIDTRNASTPTMAECQATIGSNKKSNYIIYQCSNRDDTHSVLDICKIADIILLIASPKPPDDTEYKLTDCILGLDDKSKLFCSLIKSVGGGSGTTVYGLYQPKFYPHLSHQKKNNKAQQCKVNPLIKNTFLNYLHHQFGDSNHSKNIRIFHCYDTDQMFRFMHCTKHYNDSKSNNCEWKQKRPHLLIQNIKHYDAETKILQVDGYLRGSVKLNINRPIHITGYDDYLLHKVDGLITANDRENAKKKKKKNNTAQNVNHNDDDDDDDNLMIMNFVNDLIKDDDHKMEDKKAKDCVELVTAVSDRQDALKAVGDLDALSSMFDQTIITEKELQEIDEERLKRIEKEKLEQKGLSDYNMEWHVDDDQVEQPEDDDDDVEMEQPDAIDEQEEEEDDDLMFEDEVETPMNIRAKDEFAHYRGLKQFYKTKWDKFELLPVEYSQIANIRDWKKALKMTKLEQIIATQQEMETDLIECGKKIRMHIKGISMDMYSQFTQDMSDNKPLVVWSVLEHENKVSVCHFVVQKQMEYEKPLEGMKSYVFDVGFRRFKASVVFSEHTRGNKHLVKKTIDDDQFVVASIYSKIMYGPIGVIMFDEEEETVCCNGNLLKVDAHRLLIQRKILTGNAIRVQRRRAVIRYMFWNSDDVKYFKPIDVWTKHGLKGRIEEPVGEKGYMKCFFNSHIKQNDTVCLSLYKRMFPVRDEALFNH